MGEEIGQRITTDARAKMRGSIRWCVVARHHRMDVGGLKTNYQRMPWRSTGTGDLLLHSCWQVSQHAVWKYGVATCGERSSAWWCTTTDVVSERVSKVTCDALIW